jgi:hypothetical protein
VARSHPEDRKQELQELAAGDYGEVLDLARVLVERGTCSGNGLGIMLGPRLSRYRLAKMIVAMREWRPRSPNTCIKRSAQPLTTRDCCVNSGALLTVPTTSTIPYAVEGPDGASRGLQEV